MTQPVLTVRRPIRCALAINQRSRRKRSSRCSGNRTFRRGHSRNAECRPWQWTLSFGGNAECALCILFNRTGRKGHIDSPIFRQGAAIIAEAFRWEKRMLESSNWSVKEGESAGAYDTYFPSAEQPSVLSAYSDTFRRQITAEKHTLAWQQTRGI